MAKGKYEKWLEADNLLLLQAWARNGLTDGQIAENMGVSVGTLYDWKKKYSEISEALKKGKEIVDIIVENALYKRALGYMVEETRTEEGDQGYKCVTTSRHIPGDVTALIFWLKNRKKFDWRDKQDFEVKSDNDTTINVNIKRV